MLAIILLILKLLGIVFLVASGVVILLLLLILFAPVKYCSKGTKTADEINIAAWITYLNPLIRVKIRYPAEKVTQVKVLFFTIETSKKPKKEEQTDTKASKQKAGKDKKADIGLYLTLFAENKGLISEVLWIVLDALKTVFPRKCYAKVMGGTGQADTTGFIYAAYCGLYEYLPGEVIFEPVWLEAGFEGEYSVKGKVRLIHFLTAAIKIISNKKVRLLYKKLRRV